VKVDGLTLREFQDFFAEIYAERNIERFGNTPTKGISSMWLRVVTHSGEVARAVRKRRFDLLMQELPNVFCWYCAFCSKLNIDLDQTIWAWFPRVCPTCYGVRCGCGGNKENDVRPPQKDREILDRLCRDNSATKPKSADEYVLMFGAIYGNRGTAQIDGTFLHFMEELGEVSELVQHLKLAKDNPQRFESIRSKIEIELADVFSWIAKLCWLTNEEFKGFLTYLRQDPGLTPTRNEITLSELVERRYEGGCPYCHARPCSRDCPGWLQPTPLAISA